MQAHRIFVMIERDQQDDDPDDILNVWVFANPYDAVEHGQRLEAANERLWDDSQEWLRKQAPLVKRLFDEVVRPHLYRGKPEIEAAARARLAEMIEAEIGPQPSLDAMYGRLDIFEVAEGKKAALIWSNYKRS